MFGNKTVNCNKCGHVFLKKYASSLPEMYRPGQYQDGDWKIRTVYFCKEHKPEGEAIIRGRNVDDVYKITLAKENVVQVSSSILSSVKDSVNTMKRNDPDYDFTPILDQIERLTSRYVRQK